ncbi:MAG: hypothetical protein IJ071_08525 [Ruminococcus sp.]|nr:hypothetical protein [Ruminococcus sp.]
MKAFGRSLCTAFMCLLSLFLLRELPAKAYDQAFVQIPVYCLGITEGGDQIYQLQIQPQDQLSPVPVPDALQLSEDSSGYFGITVDQPGTYSYRVWQTAGSDPDTEYDTRIFSVKVYVENTQGEELVYAVTAALEGSDEKPERLEFRNIALSESETTTTTAVTTTVTETSTSTTTEETTTRAVTTTTQAVTTKKPETIIEKVGAVLTGDNMPLALLSAIIGASAVLAVGSALLKRKDDDE